MRKTSLPVAHNLLLEAGYRVLVRTNGWAECFVQREAERWEGRGQTEEDAIDDVLGKMFPSHLARTLLEHHTRGLSRASRSGEPSEPDGDAVRASITAVTLGDPERVPPVTLGDPERVPQTPPVGVGAMGDGEPQTPPGTTGAMGDGEPRTPPGTTGAMGDGEPRTPPGTTGAMGDGEPRTPPGTTGAMGDGEPRTPPVVIGDVATLEESGTMGVPQSPPVVIAMGEGPAVEGVPAPPSAIRLESPAPAIEPHPPQALDGAVAALLASPTPEAPLPASAPPAEAAPKPPTVVGEAQKPAATARMRTAEAIESVERMLAEIEQRMGHLARMCGERQRLHMMVWICRARSVEETHPGIRDVEQAVARVARRLTEIGKMFWPGSVRALQLSARPADVRRELHATWAAEPSNWREATVLAERLLDEHLAKSPDAGLDEDGWADGAQRTPRPPDPDALFAEVDAEIKALLIPPGEVPNGRASELPSAELDQLVAAARKLRWLRGAVRDDLAWGVAVGRVRRAIPSLGDRAARVRDVLDHRTKPSVPWAKLLGEAPAEVAAPGESASELKAALGPASLTKEGLLAWLIRAFDVLNTPDLVAMVAPFKADILAFGEETLNHPDRRVRRRLRDMVKKLASVDDAPPPKAEPARAVEETTDEPVADPVITALAAAVRARTQGRRALFVSNRDDPELGSRLEELLGITITWCDGSLRRVQAQCERIKGGSYDLVLSATGFQVHGVDSALARAASSGDVPYVRVNRGRPLACVQAIAREFGLQTGTYTSLDSVKASSAS